MPKKTSKNSIPAKSIIIIALVSLLFGLIGGIISNKIKYHFWENMPNEDSEIFTQKVTQKSQTINDDIKAIEIINYATVSVISEKENASGFILTKDGLVITNKHTVESAKDGIKIIINDGTEYAAEIISTDPFDDVAIIKIKSNDQFPKAMLGDSDKLKTGQRVFAVGNALGHYGNTTTSGIISAQERQVSAFNKSMRDFQNLYGLIQTDAAMNLGNSGGPLINSEGEVIGMNTAVANSANGIGFAIPINDLKPLIESVLKHGKIIRPILGVRFLNVDEGAILVSSELGTEPAITPGSAAEKAGLVEGDIITEINNEKVSKKNPLQKIIRKMEPGAEIKVKIIRNNQKQNLQLTLGSNESS